MGLRPKVQTAEGRIRNDGYPRVTSIRSGVVWARLLQVLAQEAEEVPAENSGDVGGGIAALREEIVELREVGDAVEIERRLLGAVAAVEISADADVARVVGELADVVNVLADFSMRRPKSCGLKTL